MFIKKFVLRVAGSSLAAILLFAVPRLGAQTPSESERLEKLVSVRLSCCRNATPSWNRKLPA